MSATSEHVEQQDRIQQLLQKLGRAYLERRQFAEAYEKLRQLLEFNPQNPEYLRDTAIALIGMGDISEQAQQVYQAAVAKNPASDAIKLGLATLFMQNSVTTSFALDICEKAAALNPPNAQRIRLFLKRQYEEQGHAEKASLIEHDVVFSTGDTDIIHSYLETLWWEEKFAEAERALAQAASQSRDQQGFNLALALNRAYMDYATRQHITEPAMQNRVLELLDDLDIAGSLRALRYFLLLRSRLRQSPDEPEPVPAEIEEYEFILGQVPLEDILKSIEPDTPATRKNGLLVQPFDLRAEIIDVLERCDDPEQEAAPFSRTGRGLFFIQLFMQEGGSIPEKLTNLVSKHLSQLHTAIVRQVGSGYVGMAEDPLEQSRAIVNLLSNLENYNAAVPAQERIHLIGSIYILPATRKPIDDDTYLDALVKAAHLQRLAENLDIEESGAGIFVVHAPEAELDKLRDAGITMLPRGEAKLLPGHNATYAEIIWRNPLIHIQAGKTYRINRFELRSCLVKHKKYATYLAFDSQLDRPVIVKVLMPEDAVVFLQQNDRREELFTKLRAIGRLNHPNIANLYDMGEHNNMLYFVREYIEGKTIAEAFEGETNQESDTLGTVHTLIRALLYAQRQGVMHLNLKPANIWISEAQQLKIADFSFPGFHDHESGSGVLFPAQWRYSAPEVLSGDSRDHRSDIYSVGILAYELLARIHPYKTAGSIHAPRDIRKAQIKPLREHDIPHREAWSKFVMKCIASEPDARFKTLAEMDLELRKIQMELMQEALNEDTSS